MKKFTLLFLCAILVTSAFSLTCKVKDHLGAPALFINDKPTVPFIFYGNPEKIDSNSNFVNQALLANKAGVNIYSFRVPLIWKTTGANPVYSTLYDVVTTGNYYAPLDKVLDDVIKLDPNALIIPRFYLHPPIWWLEENPEEKMLFSDGRANRICIASTKWRNYVKNSVKEFVKHCEKKYGNKIIGYHPTLLNTGECFYERSWENVFSGFEEPLRIGFANWASNKYLSVKNLCREWNDNKITFDTITLPTAKQRANSSDGFFRDPVKDKFVIDFYEYKNFLVADTIEFVAKIIKDETHRNKIYVVFYGYTFELSAVHKGIQVTGHLAMKKLIDSPDIDVICSPISYSNRRIGGLGAFMCAADSVRRAGKLWINEDDTRTYLCTDPRQRGFGDLKTLQENLWIYNRHFARIFPRRMGTWYMDLHDLGWLDSEGIWKHISKLKSAYESQLNVTSSWNPEVAVIIDERSPAFLSCNNKLASPLYSGLRAHLYRMGTTFNIYLLSDVLDGSVKLPEVNIFLGTWYLEKSERQKLISALKGKVAVWFYGAGYMDETGASKNNISKLTGFSFKELHNKNPQIKFLKNKSWNDKLTGKTFKPALFGGMDITNVFQTYEQHIEGGYEKIWAVKKKRGVIPLAVYDDGTIGLAAAKYSGFISVYCGIAGLPAQFFRNVLKNAGVHLYINSDNMVEADNHFLSVGSYDKKIESINIAPDKYLFNILEKKKILPVNNVVKDKFQAGETKLYWILNNKMSSPSGKNL